MANSIILKPVITEKSQLISAEENKFTFVVSKSANKHQIREAVQDLFDVKVIDVNTTRMPAKLKARYTKRGLQHGRRPAYKKAIVKLPEGESIDFYGEL